MFKTASKIARHSEEYMYNSRILKTNIAESKSQNKIYLKSLSLILKMPHKKGKISKIHNVTCGDTTKRRKATFSDCPELLRQETQPLTLKEPEGSSSFQIQLVSDSFLLVLHCWLLMV